MGNLKSIAMTLSWLVNIFYIAAMVPEIIGYYQGEKRGVLSAWMLLLLVNGYAWNTFYVFCNQFPLSYTITVSITFFLSLILIIQHLYYDRAYFSSMLLNMYWFSLGIAFGMTAFSFTHSDFIGWFAGWLNVGAWSVLQVPQIWQALTRKSLEGCNMVFLCLFALGELLELCCALVLELPLQTIVSNLLSLSGYVVLFGMFFVYKGVGQNRYHLALCRGKTCPLQKLGS